MKKEYLIAGMFIVFLLGLVGFSLYQEKAITNKEKAKAEMNAAFLSTCPLQPAMCDCTVWYVEAYVPEEQRGHILAQTSKMLTMPQEELMPYLEEFFGSGSWDAQIINAMSEYCASTGDGE